MGAIATLPSGDTPLKERYYIYRRFSLHFRQNAASGDDLYWQIKAENLTPAPSLSSISPSSTKANQDVELSIYGSDFVLGATVIVGANTATPSQWNKTFILVLIPAAIISIAGSVPISIQNPDGQQSNQLALALK